MKIKPFKHLLILNLGLLSALAHASGTDAYERVYNRTVLNKPLDVYFKTMNSGWRKNIAPLRKALKPNANYIVLHAMEPTTTMDLRTADRFRQSTLSHGILGLSNDSLEIGHIFLSWRCQVNGRPVEGSVGFTGELSHQFKQLTDGGHGLSAFLHTFDDGHLQTPELLDMEWDDPKPIHTLAVEVDSSVCTNAVRFVKKFLYADDRPFETFGFTPDPENFEGGGCGSFAISVLNQSKIFGNLPIISNFWRHLRANPDLFGYGDLPVPEDTVLYNFHKSGTKEVSLVKMFTSNWNGNGPEIRILDPEMVLLFMRTVYRMNIDDIYRESETRGKALMFGKLYPYRKYPGTELASEVTVDKNFDPQASAIVKNTRGWVNSLRAQGYRGHSTVIGTKSNPTISVIFDKQE